MGWQPASHRIQPDRTLQASRSLIIESEEVLINGWGKAIEFRHLQDIVTPTDDVTVWFEEIDPQDKGFCEGISLSKSVERAKQRQCLPEFRYTSSI